MRSMTGFALVRRETSAGELTVSLRSVNHRALDLHFHQSHEFAPYENDMRALLKQGIARAHVEVRVSLSRLVTAESGGFDLGALKRYAESFQEIGRQLGLDGKPDLNTLIALPGVIGDKNTAQTLPEFSRLSCLERSAIAWRNSMHRASAKAQGYGPR